MQELRVAQSFSICCQRWWRPCQALGVQDVAAFLSGGVPRFRSCTALTAVNLVPASLSKTLPRHPLSSGLAQVRLFLTVCQPLLFFDLTAATSAQTRAVARISGCREGQSCDDAVGTCTIECRVNTSVASLPSGHGAGQADRPPMACLTARLAALSPLLTDQWSLQKARLQAFYLYSQS